MENLAQLAPLLILIPSIGAFINFFWGGYLGERGAALVGSFASGATFLVALALLSYLTANAYQPAVVNPPLLDTWISIPSGGVEIGWQQRVDTLSVAMMLFVTFVGTLIHIYASGYMHGDARFPRFFAYLNMFLAFMLTLVSGNNFVMMFVGWEGVGLCSYLLIGFWWDKPNGVGWKNANAARKAFIVNRIGDFGVLTAIFLIFWTFGTLDFYKAGEIANPEAGQAHHGEEEGDHSEEAAGVTVAGEHGEEAAASAEHSEEASAHGEEAAHGEGEEHASALIPATIYYDTPGVELHQLGVFNQTLYYVNKSADGLETEFDLGPFTLNLETILVLITLFMLLGAAGKSAQIPLFVWLPDAMAGPTPVSALIHAATMVTAGVYMIVRSNVFFYYAEVTSFIVTLVGVTTAIVAGFIALGQFDIKRVLAYSTVSQLGFMVAATGVGAFPAAMFHMITHAFFKALLFLGSGSVIHGMEHGHHEVAHHDGDDHGHAEEFDPQDMRNMGGLSKKMPITYWTYLVATLALAGIWPFAGFWSKDEILADSWLVGLEDGELKGFIALGVLIMAAGFTAFYMWRQVEMVFHGEPRTEAADHAHESGPAMTIPLMILGFFSVVIGFVNIPTGGGIFALGLDGLLGKHILGDFLQYSINKFHLPPFQPLIALSALGLGLGAIFAANAIYGRGKAINADGKDPLEADVNTGRVWALAHARLYWDEIYFALIENPFNRTAKFLANIIDWMFLHDYFHDTVLFKGFNNLSKLIAQPLDLGLVDGMGRGIGWLAQRLGALIRPMQTGYVRTYAVFLLLGVVAVILLMLFPLIQIG